MSSTILLLALCAAAQALTVNLQPTPSQAFLNNIGFQLTGPGAQYAKVVAAGPTAQRLPVLGFGELSGEAPVPSGPGLSFSNPPPPLGTGTDPGAQTCGLSPPFCTKSRYRAIDGSCNNLARPSWGMPQTPYGRLVPYNYADGVSAWPRAASGAPLPNARLLSLRLFPDRQLVSPIWNLNAQQWGQIITHDMSLTAGVAQTHKDNVTSNSNSTCRHSGSREDSSSSEESDKDQLTCCDNNGRLAPDSATNPTCAPILIPPNDPVHAPQGTQCMNFVRTTSTRDRGCTGPNAPAEPLSTVTAYMDMSLTYGSSTSQATPIRAFRGGRLLTVLRGGREWPPQDPNITLTCESAQSRNEPCYLTGDIRTNQNPQLAILQVLLLREHNRLADSLASLNPHWSDEILYQEARRIHIAQFQHINYYEYLPIFLGYDNMVKNKLIYPGAQGYINDYNPNVDPSVLDEHATAAFRHFHTLIRGYLKMFSERRAVVGTVRLSDWFNRPLILELRSAFDDLARGLTTQEEDYSDQFWDSEITQFLFKRNNTFGGDLRATDIQRGRDHGLGTYVATRAACGLPVPNDFHDLLDFISEENVAVLEDTYQSVHDVELVVAGSLERNVPGAQAGPTFLCILTEQFYRTRVGDRYFYENGKDSNTAFTPSQLKTIRTGSSMARILCDNSDGINVMQPKAFQQIGHGNQLGEPVIGVKAKEDIGCALVLCMAGAGLAPRYLADVVALDVRRTGDHSLTFRGNSLATKSMEAYLKLVGDQYLQDTLGEAVAAAAGPGAADCEVDPLRAGGGAALRRQQSALRDAVSLAWRAISASAPTFPPPLRDCFATFRERLTSMGREDISDNLISASIFLRFLCPAILSPSLFGITHEYPNERAARNLTLVAKTLQTLANFTRFQGKEAFMEFLNDFLEQEAPNMKAFLRTISSRPQDQPQMQMQQSYSTQQQQEGSNRNSSASQGSEGSRSEAAVEADPEWAPHVDLGKQLATLHGLLVDSLPKLPAARMQELDPLSDILDELSKRLVSNDIGPMPQHADNIFRFNDPTCNSPTKQNNADPVTNGAMNSNFAHSSPIMNKNGVQFNVSPSKSNAEDSKYKGSYGSVAKSPSFNLRSATLPRNGYGSNPVNQNVNPDRYSSQYNNQEHCVNLKVVQIGFGSDQYPKGISNGVNESLERRFQDRYKPNNYNQQTHYHNSNYNSTERSPSSDSINHNYCSNDMQNIMKETATLEELSDLLKYADDSDIVEDKLIMNKKNLSQSKSANNNIINGNKTNYANNGSNVSISGLSNVASSGYQSIATYSQSSSPIENTNHLHQPYENGGQPMSRYSQLNYQKQRDKQYYDSKNEKFYPKSPVQQKIEYDIQKYGIQNFTTAENTQTNTNVNSKIGPLVFTNPVYNMEDSRTPQEKKKNNENRNSKRCPCGSSSSSIDEEGLSTDNVETNSEEGSTNFNDDTRNYDQQNRNNTHRKLTRDNCNYDDMYQMSNHSHSPRMRDDESSSNSPSLRKSSKTRMPRTNPMLSYSTNQNQLNLKHFGQRGESLYESKPHHISTDSGYPMSRSDSNVEEVNKEMYRLQISRSQKALFNMENKNNSPEKYNVTENSIPETNYPLDRTYSGAKVSSSRVNEDLERHQEYYGVRDGRRESPQGVFSRESQSSEASERAPLREREVAGRDKLQRRLSLESARELTDSSDEVEDTLYSTTGRRRTSKHHRTIEQYEREIERLKCSVELLRGRLPAEPGQDHTDAKMKAIISRLICVEEELRREQRKMAAALSHKQRVIEAQEHRIAALDEANTRLLSALVHLQQRAPHPAPPHTPSSNHTQHSHQELQI